METIIEKKYNSLERRNCSNQVVTVYKGNILSVVAEGVVGSNQETRLFLSIFKRYFLWHLSSSNWENFKR
jgi:hypothetical protein